MAKDLQQRHHHEQGKAAQAWAEEEDEDYHDAVSSHALTTPRPPPAFSSRPLGGFEYFMHQAHRIHCGLIYMVAELHGGTVLPDTRLVEEALGRCVRRHPHLRARIVAGEEAALEVLLPDAAHAPSPTVPLIAHQSAVAFVEEELVRTPIAQGHPLWQLYLVQDEGNEKTTQSLVALVHHTIMDGESVVLFLKEVVATMNVLHRKDKDSILPLPPLDPVPAQDELFAMVLPPTPGDGVRGGLAFLWRRLTWCVRKD